MEIPAVVVLVLLALLLGAALGAWCARPSPSPPPPAPTPPPPRPLPLPGLLGRFLPTGEALASVLTEQPLDTAEHARILAVLAADHWQLGVSELRQQLVATSGLSPAVVDHLTHLAILALEARHAATSPR